MFSDRIFFQWLIALSHFRCLRWMFVFFSQEETPLNFAFFLLMYSKYFFFSQTVFENIFIVKLLHMKVLEKNSWLWAGIYTAWVLWKAQHCSCGFKKYFFLLIASSELFHSACYFMAHSTSLSFFSSYFNQLHHHSCNKQCCLPSAYSLLSCCHAFASIPLSPYALCRW